MKKTITFLLALFVNHFVFSQWSTNPAVNNAICTNYYNQFDIQMVSDGGGGAIITWVDYRFKPNYTVFCQRINANGIIQWASDGVQVSGSSVNANGATQSITSDGNGGAIISWVSGGQFGSIYGQHINASGAIQWAANGVIICSATATEQAPPSLTSDGNGGCIIAWNDSRNNVGINDDDLYAQRVNAAGAVQWAVNGIAVANAAGGQVSSHITSDGSGGAIIVWEDIRSGSTVEIYAQKVTITGVMQWTANGIVVNSVGGGGSLYPQLISDAGSAIICWTDRRNTDWDIYTQKLNTNGIIQWTINGVPVCGAIGNQSSSQLTSDGNGGAIITWDEPQSASIPDPNIYAQRVNASGAVQWSLNGVAVCLAASGQHFPQLTSDGSGGAVITWTDARPNNGPQDIYAQRINSSGSSLWANDGVGVSTETFIQRFPIIIKDGSNGMIISWTDFRNDLTGQRQDIYAQRLNFDGTLGGSTLPVSLLFFKAGKINNTVQLQWQTASEQNSDYFNIERSNDGVQFSSLARVAAAGNSHALKNYSSTDNNPLEGINFYRLKEVDLDGKFKFSKIVRVEMQNNNDEVHIYPNPATNNALLLLDKPAKKAVVNIFTAKGELIKRIFIPDGLTKVTIDVTSLAKGNYTIRIVNHETEETLKMLKQ